MLQLDRFFCIFPGTSFFFKSKRSDIELGKKLLKNKSNVISRWNIAVNKTNKLKAIYSGRSLKKIIASLGTTLISIEMKDIVKVIKSLENRRIIESNY